MKKEHVTSLKEKLISFETAKLAKEKGFHISSRGEGMCKRVFINGELVNTIFSSKDHIHAPTQSLLQKWLREVHNTHIQVYTMQRWLETGNNMEIYFEVNLKIGNNLNGMSNVKSNTLEFNYYEEALEIGLQEALKLIKNS